MPICFETRMDVQSRPSFPFWVSLSRGARIALLAPANGFPPQVYAPLARALAPDLAVWGWVPLPMRAQGPPPADLRWEDLAREYAAHLDDLTERPVIGLGHSLGGVMTLMAAVLRPEKFRAVVLLDPVIFEPRVLRAIRRWQRQGAPVDSAFPLARLKRGALRRRREFPSREAALRHFRSRPLFQKWQDAALEGYVRYGLRPAEDPSSGWHLAYDPRWEAAIFAAVPTDVWRWVRRVRVPGLVLFGEHSEMGTPATRCLLQRRWSQVEVQVLSGEGHLFPMEAPEKAAEAIQTWLSCRLF